MPSNRMSRKGRKTTQNNGRNTCRNQRSTSSPQTERLMAKKQVVNDQGPENDKETPENDNETLENDKDTLTNDKQTPDTNEETPKNELETFLNDQDVNKHPARADIAQQLEAASDDGVSDQEQPIEPLRTRGPNHGADIPKMQDDRPTIISIADRFPDTQVTSTITVILKGHFNGAWPTWRTVPQDIKDLMWDTFMKHFKWSPWRHNQIYKAWKTANSNRLRASLCEERKRAETTVKSGDPKKWKGHNPDWIPRRYWNRLIDDFWSTQKWQDKSISGKQNRINGNEKAEPTYTGGSIPREAHKLKMRKELKRDPTEMELYDRTHKTNGGTGEYVCPKAKRVRETYEKDMEEKYPDSENRPSFDPSIWNKASGSLSKKSPWFTRTEDNLDQDECAINMNDIEKMVEDVKHKAEDSVKEVRGDFEKFQKNLPKLLCNMLQELQWTNSKYAGESGYRQQKYYEVDDYTESAESDAESYEYEQRHVDMQRKHRTYANRYEDDFDDYTDLQDDGQNYKGNAKGKGKLEVENAKGSGKKKVGSNNRKNKMSHMR